MPAGGTRSSNKGKDKEKEQGKEHESPGNSEKEEEIGENGSNKPTYIPGFSAEQVESLGTFIDAKMAVYIQELTSRFNELIIRLSDVMTPKTTPGITKTTPDDFNQEQKHNQEVGQKHTHIPDVIVKSKPLTADTVRFFQPDY